MLKGSIKLIKDSKKRTGQVDHHQKKEEQEQEQGQEGELEKEAVLINNVDQLLENSLVEEREKKAN